MSPLRQESFFSLLELPDLHAADCRSKSCPDDQLLVKSAPEAPLMQSRVLLIQLFPPIAAITAKLPVR